MLLVVDKLKLRTTNRNLLAKLRHHTVFETSTSGLSHRAGTGSDVRAAATGAD